jgi:hypothetical protein
MFATQLEEVQHQVDLYRVIRCSGEKLIAGAEAAARSVTFVEPVQDQGAVVGRCEDEGEGALWFCHGWHARLEDAAAGGWTRCITRKPQFYVIRRVLARR